MDAQRSLKAKEQDRYLYGSPIFFLTFYPLNDMMRMIIVTEDIDSGFDSLLAQ